MPSAGFEPAIPAIKRLQGYALESTATGIGIRTGITLLILVAVSATPLDRNFQAADYTYSHTRPLAEKLLL
jgi:hypothetical protein